MKELLREKYLSRIRPFVDIDDIIKVLTGVRRCGKSTILGQIRKELLDRGIPPNDIVHINLDSKRYRNIKDADQLEVQIDSLIKNPDGKIYLFIDEVQNVEGFESLVNAYREEGYSVFITGSNSYLLSGDLMTKLTGRYMEFEIHPFSLSEMRDFYELNEIQFDADRAFENYLVFGGYPGRFQFTDEELASEYIRSVIKETIRKDILNSRTVRNKLLLEKLINHLFATPGTEVSGTSLTSYLRNEHIVTQYQTVLRYLDLILASKLCSKCLRYDIAGKAALKTYYKSYLADPSLYSLYPSRRRNIRIGIAMENIVYRELVSRGYSVTVGKLHNLEVDFVVEHRGNIAYVQVAYVMDDPQTEERKERPLLNIMDCFPKYIITRDPICFDNLGIRRLNIVRDFLLGDGFVI